MKLSLHYFCGNVLYILLRSHKVLIDFGRRFYQSISQPPNESIHKGLFFFSNEISLELHGKGTYGIKEVILNSPFIAD